MDEQQKQDYLNFLMDALQATADSNGDAKVIYPLLQANLDKLDNNLAHILQTWATAKFSEVETDTAESIAGDIWYFSNRLNNFPLGNKANNLEIVIAGYEAVLKVFTRESNPEDWAMTQNNLGLAYSDRIRGDRAENLEDAIAAYHQALSVRTKENLPIKWAATQNNLAAAYFYRIRGDQAENLENAIAAYHLALSVRTKENLPIEWAATQNNLAAAYFYRIRGDQAENLENAIAAYHLALSVYTKENLPIDWAATQNNLAIAYRNRIRGDRAENLEDAIAAYHLALSVRTKEDLPIDWAATQNNLALAYRNRIRGDRAENLENAIAAFHLALSVRTKEDLPIQWATTQNNLAIAYCYRIRGDRAENLENAIAAFHLALSVRTKKDLPIEWATTQNNLAAAYFYRIRGDQAENLENAIAAYHLALSVYTKENLPIDWAMTQNNLGAAYCDRIRGDRAENLESAIAAYHLALSVRTKEDLPIDWATTQNNLAIAYCYRIRGDRAENLENAIAAYHQALSVYTKEDFPIDWAMTQNNLASAYCDRIRGDRAENLESAIAAYHLALEVRKPETLPAECLQTARNLADFASKQENYQLAIDNYEIAIAAIEQSRDWIPDEIARQEILRKNIYVYENMIQACVNAEQYDKALETVERFRCRRLLDLILTKDLYKNGEVPEDIRKLEAEMEAKQREIDNLRRQLETPEDHQEKAGASRHVTRDEWDDITEEIQKLMTEKREIWQKMRRLDRVLAEGIQAPSVSVEGMKKLLEFRNDPPQPPLERGELLNPPQPPLERGEMLNPPQPPLERGEMLNPPQPPLVRGEMRDDVALLSFYTTDDDTYIFILTQAGVKLHRCQGEGLNDLYLLAIAKLLNKKYSRLFSFYFYTLIQSLQQWLRDNWFIPYSEIDDLAAFRSAANLAKCDIDAIESINPKPTNVVVKLTDGKEKEISLSEFKESRKQQKQELYKQWQDKMEKMLKELADRLQINQLVAKLTDIKEIILVPYMYLHQIPLPALPLQDGKYLGDRFRVRIAPSTQVLGFCRQQPENPVANLPRYGIVENTRDDLAYTPKECKLVAQIYGVAPQHHLKGSKQATKAKYKELLTQIRVLGLLSSHHAKSNLTQPLESRLLLGDTDITLGELLNASIRFPQLLDVFLSCCETALGDSELTDDIFTLSAAFLCAGASNVISSLWAVNDLATTVLSYFFHRNRAEGIGSADALWLAQMELKELTLAKANQSLENAEAILEEFAEGSQEYEKKEKIVNNCQEVYDLVLAATESIGGEKPFNHPYYWAGFICQGEG